MKIILSQKKILYSIRAGSQHTVFLIFKNSFFYSPSLKNIIKNLKFLSVNLFVNNIIFRLSNKFYTTRSWKDFQNNFFNIRKLFLDRAKNNIFTCIGIYYLESFCLFLIITFPDYNLALVIHIWQKITFHLGLKFLKNLELSKTNKKECIIE